MAKKNQILDYDDDDILLDKKAKRKLAKAQQQQQKQIQAEIERQDISATASPEPEPAVSASDNIMSQIAVLCQAENWREAALICQQEINRQREAGTPENAIGVEMALKKIDKSLRRKMAAAFVVGAKQLLKKEYLLDV